MKRIIIEISTLSDENWRLIYRFVDKYDYRGNFTNEDFVVLSNVAKIYCHDVERQEDAIHAYGSVLSFDNFNRDIEQGDNFSFAIVYVKQDDSADFSLIMPYFVGLAQAQHKDTEITFGVDVTQLSNKDEYIYKFGQILNFINLPKPSVGIRSFYYIYWAKNNNQRKITYNFPNKAKILPKNESVSSRRFLAILKIDPNILPLFSRSWNENADEDSQSTETFKWVKKSIVSLNERLNHVKPLQNDKFSSLFEEWFIKAYLYSFADSARTQKTVDSKVYHALKMILHEYSTNIYELVQNIIFHTEEKRGLLSILFNKKKNLSPLLQSKIPDFANYEDDDRFVEIGIYDYGKVGIVEKFGNKGLTLLSFFNPKDILPDDSDKPDYLSLRYSAHLGIKTFVSSVMKHKGYFCAESNTHDGMKSRIESNGDILVCQKVFSSLCGTHYNVVLPVKESETPSSFEPIQSASIIDILKQNLTKPLIPVIVAREIFNDDQFAVSDKSDQKEKLVQAGDVIIEKSFELANESHKVQDICIDMDGYKKISPNLFFKLIAYLQLSKLQFEKIIFVNLVPEDVDAMCRIILNLSSEVSSKNQPIWSSDHAVVLIDRELKARIFCGETKSEISYINHKLKDIYIDKNNDLCNIGDGRFDKTGKEVLNRFIIPYDCLSGSMSRNAFLCYVDNILNTPLDEQNIGCLVDMPTRIGSKLYIDHFYEADFLFQNSFFTDRFAFYAARDIISQAEPFGNKMILVGYNYYSEVLINRIKDYINYWSPARVICVVTAVSEDNSNGLKFKGCTSLNDGITYDVVTVVPIGSTLSTIDKVIANFRHSFGRYNIRFTYNYCSILIRDEVKEGKGDSRKTTKCTKMEKCWKWKCVKENTVETIFSNAKKVHFLLAKRSKWHHLIDKETFPPRKECSEYDEKEYNYWNEKYVNQTRNSALNIRDYVKFPIAAIPYLEGIDYYDSHRAAMKELSHFIYFGHILHNHDHHRYYFDINRYIIDFEAKTGQEKEQTQLNRWLRNELKDVNSGLYNSQYINVIVTPDPDSAPYLANLINEYVFNNNAYILFLNIRDYHENIKTKHSFFRQLSFLSDKGTEACSVRYHFVDQALVTGESYQKTKSHMVAILGDPTFKFYDIITIINRLSKDKYEEIASGLNYDGKCGIFSYTHFFILPSKLPGSDCSLCRLRDYFEELKAHSVIRDCRKVIEANKFKYNEIPYSLYWSEGKIENRPSLVSDRERYGRRMEWRNRLFYAISLLCGYQYKDLDTKQMAAEVEKKLKELYSECEDIDDKIPYLKAISFPPLSEYVGIRRYAFNLMLSELKKLLEKVKPQMYDFFFLKVLLKHLAMLGSNALVRQDVIYGACQLYGKVCDQLPEEIMCIRASISQDRESLTLCREKLKFIRNEIQKQPNRTFFEEIREEGSSYGQHYEALAKEQKNLEEELKRIPNEITSLEDKLSYIYEYTGLNDNIVDAEKIKESISGNNKINGFINDLHFYIKIATHQDESKSLWLGEMMRRGKEMNANEFDKDYKVKKTIMFNPMFKGYNRSDEFYHSLSPLLFYDNTSIIRKTLDDFEKEIQNNNLKDDFYDGHDERNFREFKKNISNVVGKYLKLIKENYYYSWFKLFLEEKDNDCFDRSNDNIPLVKKYIEVLYGRLILKKLLNHNQKAKDSFDKNARYLLEVFASIMDAQAAFVVIKPENSDQLYTLTCYVSEEMNQKEKGLPDIETLDIRLHDNSFYCKKLMFEEDDSQKGRPFVVRKDVSLEGESFDDSYQKATFLALNKNKIGDIYSEQATDVLVGMVVFLYTDKGSNTRFMIEKQELGRLLLLLKPETDAYVSHVANERFFDIWVTQRHLARLTFADNHKLALSGWDFENIPLGNYKKIYNGIIMLSNVVVRHLYANLMYNGEINLNNDSIYLSDLFDDKYISLLQEIVKKKWDSLITLRVEDPPKGISITGLKTVFRSYIIQLLYNANKHADCREVCVFFGNGFIEIRNDILKKDEEIKKLRNQFKKKYTTEEMEKFVKSPNYIKHYGFTLLTLFYYCRSVNMRCDMDFEKYDGRSFFYVKLIY